MFGSDLESFPQDCNLPFIHGWKRGQHIPSSNELQGQKARYPNPRLLKKELPEEDAHQTHTATDSVNGKQMASVQLRKLRSLLSTGAFSSSPLPNKTSQMMQLVMWLLCIFINKTWHSWFYIKRFYWTELSQSFIKNSCLLRIPPKFLPQLCAKGSSTWPCTSLDLLSSDKHIAPSNKTWQWLHGY